MPIAPDTRVRLIDDVQELQDVTEAMKRAIKSGLDLRLHDHIARLHELNLRLAKSVGFNKLAPDTER